MSNQHNTSTHGSTQHQTPGNAKNHTDDQDKGSAAGRKGSQDSHTGKQGSHAAGSGSTTGDPGNARSQPKGSAANVGEDKDKVSDTGRKGGEHSHGHN